MEAFAFVADPDAHEVPAAVFILSAATLPLVVGGYAAACRFGPIGKARAAVVQLVVVDDLNLAR